MAQISLPVLNKTGYSMFWGTVWNDPYNSTRNWKEDLLIFTILPFFIQTPYVCLHQFLDSTQFLKLPQSTNYNYYNFDIPFYKMFIKKISRKFYKIYFFKVWIIKFQNWILIYAPYLNTKFRKPQSKRSLGYLSYVASVGYNIFLINRANSINYYLKKFRFEGEF